MNIVSPGASFTLKFIPRHRAEILDSFVIRNKNTNTETTISDVDYMDYDYYVEADVTHTVAEGEFFQYTVYNTDSDVSYIGIIFCTAQSTYSINDGEYTQNSTDNEFITR